jgi:hypothetical protein
MVFLGQILSFQLPFRRAQTLMPDVDAWEGAPRRPRLLDFHVSVGVKTEFLAILLPFFSGNHGIFSSKRCFD